MTKTYRFRIYPNAAQRKLISKTFGCCRLVYNKFLEANYKDYDKQETYSKKKYIGAYQFSKEWLTPAKKMDEYSFLEEASSKALKDSIENAHKAFLNFFKHPKRFHHPRFKSKRDPVQSFFFIKDGVRFNKNHIWIPVLRWVRTTQDNYIPECGEITGGRIVLRGNKYYADIKVKVPYGYRVKEARKFAKRIIKSEFAGEFFADSGSAIGIDVGVKTYATIVMYNRRTGNADSIKIDTFLKDRRVLDIEEKIKTLQKIISRKTEINKSKKLKKGVCYASYNIRQLRKKIAKLYEKLRSIKMDFINKLCYSLAITKPDYITIENLLTETMLHKASHKLADKIQKSCFREFSERLAHKCKEFDVELRVTDQYYPSSKMCCVCGHKKSKLKLSERTFVCDNPDCGKYIDRDINAAVNLLNCHKFNVVK